MLQARNISMEKRRMAYAEQIGANDTHTNIVAVARSAAVVSITTVLPTTPPTTTAKPRSELWIKRQDMTTASYWPTDSGLLSITSLPQASNQPNPNYQVTNQEPTTGSPDSTMSIPPTPLPQGPNPNDQITNEEPTSVPPTIAPNPIDQLTNKEPTTSPLLIPSPLPQQPRPDTQIDISEPTGSAADNSADYIAPSRYLTNTRIAGTTRNGGQGSQTVAPIVVSPVSSTAASVLSGSLTILGDLILATSDHQGPHSSGSASATTQAVVGALTLTNAFGNPTTTLDYTGAVVLTGSAGQTTGAALYTGSAPIGVAYFVDSIGRTTATLPYTGTILPLATQSAASPSSDPQDDNDDNKHESYSVASKFANQEFTEVTYFSAVYLPSLIGVFLQSAWLVVFATFKLMEPFYALSSPRGASAMESLTADYVSTGLSLTFNKAMSSGHFVLPLAGVIQLLLAIVMMLASEAMNVIPTAYCQTEISDHQPCSPRWVVHTLVVRFIEFFLVWCFSLVISIIVLNRKRLSGVYSDPSRIATIADLIIHPPLIQEIRDLPSLATKAQIEHDLRNSRYMLGTFIGDNKRLQYGILKLDGNTTSRALEKEASYKTAYRRFATSSAAMVDHIQKSVPFLADAVCVALIVSLSGMILAFWLSPFGANESSFNAWMGSGDFGPSMTLTAMAIGISFLIKRKERIARLSHPYVLMAQGPQPASDTLTAGTRATQFTSMLQSFFTLDITLGLLSFVAFLSDGLIVVITGIPFTTAQTGKVYKVSTFVCLGLLGFLLLVQLRVLFKDWKRRRSVSTEYPDTLASVLMRLCASKFVEEKNIQGEWEKDVLGPRLIEEFGQDDAKKQRRRYEGPDNERRYEFTFMTGVDGIARYMVDEVPAHKR